MSRLKIVIERNRGPGMFEMFLYRETGNGVDSLQIRSNEGLKEKLVEIGTAEPHAQDIVNRLNADSQSLCIELFKRE